MSSDEVIISYGNAALRQSDIDTLQPDEWVNDAIITFVYEIIENHLNDDQIGLWPPSVAELLANIPSDQENIQSLLPKLKKCMVLPISDRYGNPKGTSTHWSCLIYRDDQATHFDSLSPANIDASQLLYEKLSKIQNLTLAKLKEGKVISQSNACDCGLYTILIPFCYFMENNKEHDIQESVLTLTPDKVANFRIALHDWLFKWSNLSANVKDRIQSYNDIIQQIGPVSYEF